MSAYIKTLIVFSCVCFLMGACTSSSPANLIPSGTQADLFTPFPSPLVTATPRATSIPAAPTNNVSPTPEFGFHGFNIEDLHIADFDVKNRESATLAEIPGIVEYILAHPKLDVNSCKPIEYKNTYNEPDGSYATFYVYPGSAAVDYTLSVPASDGTILPLNVLELCVKVDGVKKIVVVIESEASLSRDAEKNFRVFGLVLRKITSGNKFTLKINLSQPDSSGSWDNPILPHVLVKNGQLDEVRQRILQGIIDEETWQKLLSFGSF